MADLLDDIQIASPCPAKWEEMAPSTGLRAGGDERARFCAQCRLNVFNIAGMERADALALIRQKEGRLCARIFRRKDGTVITKDCPVGVRKLRRKVAMGLTGAVAFLVAGSTFASNFTAPECDAQPSTFTERVQRARQKVRSVEPMKSLLDWIDPQEDFVDVTVTAGVIMDTRTVGTHSQLEEEK